MSQGNRQKRRSRSNAWTLGVCPGKRGRDPTALFHCEYLGILNYAEDTGGEALTSGGAGERGKKYYVRSIIMALTVTLNPPRPPVWYLEKATVLRRAPLLITSSGFLPAKRDPLPGGKVALSCRTPACPRADAGTCLEITGQFKTHCPLNLSRDYWKES